MGMIIYFVIILLLPLYAQFKVKGTYKKYDKVHGMNGYTGAEVARMIFGMCCLHAKIYYVKVQGFSNL